MRCKEEGTVPGLEEQEKVLEKVTPKLICGDISRGVREEGHCKPRSRRNPALIAVRTPLPRSPLLFFIAIIANRVLCNLCVHLFIFSTNRYCASAVPESVLETGNIAENKTKGPVLVELEFQHGEILKLFILI